MTLFIARLSLRWKPRISFFSHVLRPTLHNLSVRCINTTASVRDVSYADNENSLLRSILCEKPECSSTLIPPRENEVIEQVSPEQFESLVASEFGSWAPEVVAAGFLKASAFATANDVQISDERLRELRAALVRAVPALPDHLLLDCLRALRLWPVAPSPRDSGFSEVWRALDMECAARVAQWPTEKLLFVADHWAALRLASFSHCVAQALKRLLRKPARLSPPHLVQALFYANTMRKPSTVVDMIEVEVALEKCLEALSLDDFGIVAAAFFKGQTKIRSDVLMSHMMREVMEQAGRARDIPLAALLKVVRYSARLTLSQRLYGLLGTLQPEVQRLSLLTCAHLALVGTNMQLLHEGVVRAVLARVVKESSSLRLKELERLSLVVSLFNLPSEAPSAAAPAPEIITVPSVRRSDSLPATFAALPLPAPEPSALEAAVERELRARVDSQEMALHPKCLPRALTFLSGRRVFPLDLIARALSAEALRKVYGKNAHAFQPELLNLDLAVELECPKYDGPRLTPKDRTIIAKQFRQSLPLEEGRGSFADKLMYQVIVAARDAAGGEDRVAAKHLLPQFKRGDVVLRMEVDNGSGSAEPRCLALPASFVLAQPTGDPFRAPATATSSERWVALIPAGWNCFIHGDGNGTRLSGSTVSRIRYLSLIGYTPVVVPWFEWIQRPKKHRADYLWEILSATALAPEGTYVTPIINPGMVVSEKPETASQRL